MSIESVLEAHDAPVNHGANKVEMNANVNMNLDTPRDFKELGEALLADDVNFMQAWQQSSSAQPTLIRHQSYPAQTAMPQPFLACPPVQLTRHASLPVSMARSHSVAMSRYVMATTVPTLTRHHSNHESYLAAHHQQHEAFPAYAMSPRIVTYHPHPMLSPVAIPMNTIHLSVAHQQPMTQPQVPVATTKPAKPEMDENDVEPIAFTGRLSEVRMSLSELDSFTLAMLSDDKTEIVQVKEEPKHHEEQSDFRLSRISIGCAQDLESALNSLVPDMDDDFVFRPSLAAPEPSTSNTMLTTPRDHCTHLRRSLPTIMSPHLKTVTPGSAPMPMMMNIPQRTPRASPKQMATCKIADCDRRVRSKGFCKTHGGGRKCSIEGCKKSSQNGDFCIGHGGGKKCKHEGCAKAAQSHGLCKAHGGGARCKYPDCNKSSQGGGLCRAHGGGKRCQAEGCPKGAQRGNFCATHGGFRNCKIDGCVRTDRGGGFCEVHRRGRLCKVDGCKKLARNQGMCTMHIREDNQDIVSTEEMTVCFGMA
ncbi:hypothetical protein Poli38472_014057 [Pythium oligandrum]|uniref:WRKY19-like zinc finger domain-containing protein n=1 Tax=Pythium oligandrum TaxID=41045 RepID=A0A8K1CNT1_PYTOL|nr:hypothetical protein Poli38472_014057 [Pythium oligandrum]|eukprot:TMW66745.1 hypothetical protein Poli38472_014057 [Pythium oligandrum]